MTPSQVLRKAAELIEQRGWCRCCYTDSAGRLCVVGALRATRNGDAGDPFCDWDQHKAFSMLSKCIDGIPSRWNDAPERTKDQVIAALRAAAEVGDGQ
jgi:hypothetical protein